MKNTEDDTYKKLIKVPFNDIMREYTDRVIRNQPGLDAWLESKGWDEKELNKTIKSQPNPDDKVSISIMKYKEIDSNGIEQITYRTICHFI